MGYNKPDPYNQPEKFDLDVVFTAEEEGLSYEFNMFVVWKDVNGDLYYATDAGCSCPSPFEDFESLADLTPGSRADIVNAMHEWYGANDETKADLLDALYA